MVCIFLLYTLCYENLIHHFPTYMLCLLFLKKAYRELNLERALNEDTGPGDFSILSFSPLGQTAVMYILYVTICILYAYNIHIIT